MIYEFIGNFQNWIRFYGTTKFAYHNLLLVTDCHDAKMLSRPAKSSKLKLQTEVKHLRVKFSKVQRLQVQVLHMVHPLMQVPVAFLLFLYSTYMAAIVTVFVWFAAK